MSLNVVVLAGGKGTRMKSLNPNHSKVVYPILGKPMVNYVVDAAKGLHPDQIIVVVGFGGEATAKLVEQDAKVVWQKELLGTAHAALQSESLLKEDCGVTIVLGSDAPLITTTTLSAILHKHNKEENDMTVVSSVLEEPAGYGRIFREKSTRIAGIKEDKDCDEYEKEITEINAGIYVFKTQEMLTYLKRVTNHNSGHEYYITDVVALMVNDHKKVGSYVIEDATEILGVNDRYQFAYAQKVIRRRVNEKLMIEDGVSIEDSASTFISPDVVIGKDTVIMPNVAIIGKCRIGNNNMIGPNAHIERTDIGDDNVILSDTVFDSKIGNRTTIESYCSLNHEVVEDDTKVSASPLVKSKK